MSPRLPNLNQLRAFEAAARLGSFKAAAEELCVTQAAVSHRIKGLEEDLGRALFRRGTRRVSLLEDARPLAAELTRGFEAITAALGDLRTGAMSGRLRLSVAPFFGNRWLLPRLAGFGDAHPDIEIETVLSFDMVDLEKEDFDAALRYGTGAWPGLGSRLIYRDGVGPVAAPDLVEGMRRPMSVSELAALPLASTASWPGDWQDWFDRAGLAPGRLPVPMVLDNRALVFDAVLSGQAMAVFDTRMTAMDEARGRLVRLHPLTVERPQGIHLARPAQARPDPRIEAFVTWLRQEAEA